MSGTGNSNVTDTHNAQVFALQKKLPGDRIGTVDKFQGQKVPLVIYSMAVSTASDALHGMEFLYSLNRLNVATSRVYCACLLAANPVLFESECRKSQRMRLANAFCRYRKLVRTFLSDSENSYELRRCQLQIAKIPFRHSAIKLVP